MKMRKGNYNLCNQPLFRMCTTLNSLVTIFSIHKSSSYFVIYQVVTRTFSSIHSSKFNTHALTKMNGKHEDDKQPANGWAFPDVTKRNQTCRSNQMHPKLPNGASPRKTTKPPFWKRKRAPKQHPFITGGGLNEIVWIINTIGLRLIALFWDKQLMMAFITSRHCIFERGSLYSVPSSDYLFKLPISHNKLCAYRPSRATWLLQCLLVLPSLTSEHHLASLWHAWDNNTERAERWSRGRDRARVFGRMERTCHRFTALIYSALLRGLPIC